MATSITVTAEDQLQTLGLVMAHVEHPDVDTLPPEYLEHLAAVLEERGLIPVTHGLVSLATLFVFTLANEWGVPPEVVVSRTAAALAQEHAGG